MTQRKTLAAALQRQTYLVPVSVAYLIGLLTWQHWTYFVVMALLALGPAVFGCADPVGELIDYIGRERRRLEDARRRAETVARHAAGFLSQVNRQSADELRLMAQCIIRGRNGFNRADTDPATRDLLARGFVFAEPGFTPAGFPYYFTDRAWVLMNELKADIFAAHDRIASPPVTPPVPPGTRFDPLIFALDLLLWAVKGPVLIALILTGAGFAWAAWLFVMGSVILAMVLTGYGVGWLLGF